MGLAPIVSQHNKLHQRPTESVVDPSAEARVACGETTTIRWCSGFAP